MSAVMQEPQVIRKARSVQNRIDEISEDVRVIDDNKACDRAARTSVAVICECNSVAKQWRAIVEFIGNATEAGERLDYRQLGEIVGPAADQTLTVFKYVLASATEPQDTSGRIEGSADLEIAVREMTRIVEWIKTWPTNDPTDRNIAREAIARGEAFAAPAKAG